MSFHRVPALKRQALIQMFVLPVILALELKVVHVPLWVYGLIVLILAGLWNAYLLWVRRRAVIALADARPGAIGLHTLALAPDGHSGAEFGDGSLCQVAESDGNCGKQNVDCLSFSAPVSAFWFPNAPFRPPKERRHFWKRHGPITKAHWTEPRPFCRKWGHRGRLRRSDWFDMLTRPERRGYKKANPRLRGHKKDFKLLAPTKVGSVLF